MKRSSDHITYTYIHPHLYHASQLSRFHLQSYALTPTSLNLAPAIISSYILILLYFNSLVILFLGKYFC